MSKDLNTDMTLCKKCGAWFQSLGPNWVHNCNANMLIKVEQPNIIKQEFQIKANFEIYSIVDEEPKRLSETEEKALNKLSDTIRNSLGAQERSKPFKK